MEEQQYLGVFSKTAETKELKFKKHLLMNIKQNKYKKNV